MFKIVVMLDWCAQRSLHPAPPRLALGRGRPLVRICLQGRPDPPRTEDHHLDLYGVALEADQVNEANQHIECYLEVVRVARDHKSAVHIKTGQKPPNILESHIMLVPENPHPLSHNGINHTFENGHREGVALCHPALGFEGHGVVSACSTHQLRIPPDVCDQLQRLLADPAIPQNLQAQSTVHHVAGLPQIYENSTERALFNRRKLLYELGLHDAYSAVALCPEPRQKVLQLNL